MRGPERTDDTASSREGTRLARADALWRSLSSPSWRIVWMLLALTAAAVGAAAPGEFGIP